jgi:DNA-binding response OmpR family regulator
MLKILLVDDENLILYSLSSTLRNDGTDVTAVSNGKDALSAIEGACFDICFLDVNLPDGNGLELMKKFLEISPATRIIIMTAVDLDEEQLKMLSVYGSHYLPKPFDLDDVRSVVNGISKEKNASRQAEKPREQRTSSL